MIRLVAEEWIARIRLDPPPVDALDEWFHSRLHADERLASLPATLHPSERSLLREKAAT